MKSVPAGLLIPGWTVKEVLLSADIPLVGVLEKDHLCLVFWYLGASGKNLLWAYTPFDVDLEEGLAMLRKKNVEAEDLFESLPVDASVQIALISSEGFVLESISISPRPGDFHALCDATEELLKIELHSDCI